MDLQMAYQDAQGNQIPLPPDVWEATHPAARQFILLLRAGPETCCYRSNCMAASCPGSMAITGLWLGDGEGSPGRSGGAFQDCRPGLRGADQRASVVPKASSLVACSRQGWSTSSLPSRAAAARQL